MISKLWFAWLVGVFIVGGAYAAHVYTKPTGPCANAGGWSECLMYRGTR